MNGLIKNIARRILRDEIEKLRREAVIAGRLAVEREVLEERRLAGPHAVEAWNAAVEAGCWTARRYSRPTVAEDW